MKILIIAVILCIPFVCVADNKIYFDTAKNLEVVDLSGVKTIQQINSSFHGNFTDVTSQRKLSEKQSENQQKIITDKEKLIQDKIREQAIATLKVEGKLDSSGNIVK